MPKTSEKQRVRAAQKAEEERAVAERRLSVARFRDLGLTYRAIGEKLGISHAQARADDLALLEEIKAQSRETVEEMRDRENRRLDMATLAISTAVLRGELKAVEEWRKLSETRCKLNGLFAPAGGDTNEDEAIAGAIAALEAIGFKVQAPDPENADLEDDA